MVDWIRGGKWVLSCAPSLGWEGPLHCEEDVLEATTGLTRTECPDHPVRSARGAAPGSGGKCAGYWPFLDKSMVVSDASVFPLSAQFLILSLQITKKSDS